MAGPYLAVGPFAEVTLDVAQAVCWTAEGGLRAKAGLEIDLWLLEIEAAAVSRVIARAHLGSGACSDDDGDETLPYDETIRVISHQGRTYAMVDVPVHSGTYSGSRTQNAPGPNGSTESMVMNVGLADRDMSATYAWQGSHQCGTYRETGQGTGTAHITAIRELGGSTELQLWIYGTDGTTTHTETDRCGNSPWNESWPWAEIWWSGWPVPTPAELGHPAGTRIVLDIDRTGSCGWLDDGCTERTVIDGDLTLARPIPWAALEQALGG